MASNIVCSIYIVQVMWLCTRMNITRTLVTICQSSCCTPFEQILTIRIRDGNGPGRPRAGPGLKIQARGPHGPKRA